MTSPNSEDVIRTLLKGKPYQSSKQNGIFLIRSDESESRFTQLDAIIPEFRIPRTSLATAEMLLLQKIAVSLDSSVKGLAGSILGDTAQIGPLDKHERSAREILTMLATQAGGAWVAGACPVLFYAQLTNRVPGESFGEFGRSTALSDASQGAHSLGERLKRRVSSFPHEFWGLTNRLPKFSKRFPAPETQFEIRPIGSIKGNVKRNNSPSS